MTVSGETICTGAPPQCPECLTDALNDLRTRYSDAGWSLQTWCLCGPYTRETIYVGHDLAERAEKLCRERLAVTSFDGWVDAFREVLHGLGIERS